MKFIIHKMKYVSECDCCADTASTPPAPTTTIFDGPDRWDNILGVGYQTPNNTLHPKRKKKVYARKRK